MKSLPSLVIALLLCGCGNVYTAKPIGEKPKDLTREAADWEGDWINGGGDAFRIKVADPAGGVLKVASIDESQGGFQLKQYTIYLRVSGEWCFASCKDPDGKEKSLYNWAKVSRSDRQILCWAPDSDKFEELVKSGKLPGKADKEKVVLGDLTAKDMELITSGSVGVPFSWDSPLVLTKISQ